MEPYISPDDHWMLVHHGIFQNVHSLAHPSLDHYGREKWRGHPAFEQDRRVRRHVRPGRHGAELRQHAAGGRSSRWCSGSSPRRRGRSRFHELDPADRVSRLGRVSARALRPREGSGRPDRQRHEGALAEAAHDGGPLRALQVGAASHRQHAADLAARGGRRLHQPVQQMRLQRPTPLRRAQAVSWTTGNGRSRSTRRWRRAGPRTSSRARSSRFCNTPPSSPPASAP